VEPFRIKDHYTSLSWASVYPFHFISICFTEQDDPPTRGLKFPAVLPLFMHWWWSNIVNTNLIHCETASSHSSYFLHCSTFCCMLASSQSAFYSHDRKMYSNKKHVFLISHTSIILANRAIQGISEASLEPPPKCCFHKLVKKLGTLGSLID
jgi:hypothetical protein